MKPLLRLLSLLAFVSFLPTLHAADLSGSYKGAFDYQGSSVPLTVNLKIDGSTVTGTVEGLPTTPSEIHEGTLAGDIISFWINTDYQGQTYKLLCKGKVATDEINFDIGTEDGSWSTPLTVKKSAPTTAAAPPPSADVNGNWKGTVDLNGTPTQLIYHLKSSGDAVTGTIEREGAPPVDVHEGKIEGDTISFWITTDYEGQSYTIVYKGKVAAGQIDFDFGTADQSWSASMTVKKTTDAAPAAVSQTPATPQAPNAPKK
jgi:hypothetical protein